MIGLGKWEYSIDAEKHLRLKSQKKTLSQGKSLLSIKGLASGSGESAAVHFVQSNLARFSDEYNECDNDPAVVRTVEMLTAAGSDALVYEQEKETRSSGGIPFR